MNKAGTTVDDYAHGQGDSATRWWLSLRTGLLIIMSVGVLGIVVLKPDMENLLRMDIMLCIGLTAVLLFFCGLLFTIMRRLKNRQARITERGREMVQASMRTFTSQEQANEQFARKLHDSTVQTLVAIKTRVELASQHAREKGLSDDAEHLATILPIIQDTIDEVRTIAMDLRPLSLDDLGVIPTLTWLCRKSKSRYAGLQLETRFEIREQDIPQALKISIFRGVQETLNRLGPFAGDKAMCLMLCKEKGAIIFSVEGHTVAEMAARRPGMRQLSMHVALSELRERVMQTGGAFSLEPVQNKNGVSRIYVSWPIAGQSSSLMSMSGKVAGLC